MTRFLALALSVACAGKSEDTGGHLPPPDDGTTPVPEPTPTKPPTDTATTPPATTTPAPTWPDSLREACVDRINGYRATLSLPPYTRWTDAEICVDGQARADFEAYEPHSAFGQCGEWAQNECPGWPSPAEDVIAPCFQLMWDEGPGEPFEEHGHYINMSNADYTEVACGFYTTPDGAIWATQDFR